jgi:glycosyltransferase involved in cell wall biosynthesis
MRVSVLDIEPIDPAEGGSRLRLKGLYHALGPAAQVTYVGAFHWFGPQFRRLRHGPNFEEVTVPFSQIHCAAAETARMGVGGKTIVDASFPRLGGLSGDFCAQARTAAADADVVIFSHPWVFAVTRDQIQPDRQLVVYDAHNVEGVLRRELLSDTPLGREIAQEVEVLERELCQAADLVLACSHADRVTFVKSYGIDYDKTRVFPNGVFAREIEPACVTRREEARARLGLGRGPVALFIGGYYPPNVAAAEFIRDRVAPQCPDVTFVILGGAGAALLEKGSPTEPNVRVTGGVREAEKLEWLAASDLGLNPMFSGSGTNIKMFDYFAAGLSVITTPFGMRGIGGEGVATIADTEEFAHQVANHAELAAASRAEHRELSRRGRALIEREFDWSTISAELGATIANHARSKKTPRPFFSVTIPTYDRPDRLRRLLDLLAVQSERDFEVIVVDQSDVPYDGPDHGLDLTILHSSVRGAARARNLAATVARGRVLTFVDDDCEPCDTWLSEAKSVFEQLDPVGLEGRVMSDRMHDPRWRSVHNYGVEGLGFMTCNLFARADAFHAVGGFDTAFDESDFRYDTDFGWRLQTLGDIPFSERAFVYHPPWSRAIERESEAARNELFEGDALLLRKHPDQYRELFLREGHWRKGSDFWSPFLRGARKYDVVLPDYVLDTLMGRSADRARDRHITHGPAPSGLCVMLCPPWPRSGSSHLFHAQVKAYLAMGLAVAVVVVPHHTDHRPEATGMWNLVSLDFSFDPRQTLLFNRSRQQTRRFVSKSYWSWLVRGRDSALAIQARLAGRSELHPELVALLSRHGVEIIHVNHCVNLGAAKRIAACSVSGGHPAPKLLLDTHDVQSDRYRDCGIVNPFTHRVDSRSSLERNEVALCRDADVLLHVSTSDLAHFRSILPDKEHRLVRPTTRKAVEAAGRPLGESPIDFVYIGDGHATNTRSITWFLEAVAPLLDMKQLRVRIAGGVAARFRDRHPQIFAAYPEVWIPELHDVRSLYAVSRFVIVPMKGGTGASIKLIEAFGMGKFAVATSEAVAGFAGIEDLSRAVIIANGAEEFAAAMTGLSDRGDAVNDAGRAIYERHFSNSIYEAALAEVVRPSAAGG